MLSLNTNRGAQQALQVLTATSAALAGTRARISTGFAVAGTKDDSATYGIAQGLRSDLLNWKAVGSSLTRWQSVTDVAVAGAEQISDLINTLRQKAYAFAGAVGDAESQAAIRADMEALVGQIDTVGDSASFGGVNLLRGAPITATRTSYLYGLPGSTANPAGFVAPAMAALPPGSSASRFSDVHYFLPPSPLTPASFETARGALQGPGPKVVTLDAGDVAGRVNLLLDNEGFAADRAEIWQNGVRVAASGQPYAAAGAAVGSATGVTGPSVVSFDYDPAKGKTLELRVNQGMSPANDWSIRQGNFQLQDPAEPVPTPFGIWSDMVTFTSTGQFNPPVSTASPEQVVQAMDDPLDERVLPQNNAASYTVSGGSEAGRVDVLFDAFEQPDTMEVWQDGVRIAATGQAYASGGGAVAAAVPVRGANMVSFDYDPANGPLTFTFNGEGADPKSAWLVGGVSLRKNPADPIPPVESYASGVSSPSFGPVRYDFATTPMGDQARIASHDLRSAALGIDRGQLPWNDPQALISAVDRASGTVRNVASYLGRHHQALNARLAQLGRLSDTLSAGIGNLVDADLAQESAALQAGQVKEQLATQALAIANQAPQLLLSLFR